MNMQNVIYQDDQVCLSCWSLSQPSSQNMNIRTSTSTGISETKENKLSLKTFNINKKQKQQYSKVLTKTYSTGNLPLFINQPTMRTSFQHNIRSSHQNFGSFQRQFFSRQASEKQLIIPKSQRITSEQKDIQQLKKEALRKSLIRNFAANQTKDTARPKKIQRLLDSQVNILTSLNNSATSINNLPIQTQVQESIIIQNFFHPDQSNLSKFHSQKKFQKEGIRVTNSIVIN